MDTVMKRLQQLAGSRRLSPRGIPAGRLDDPRMGSLFTDDFCAARVVVVGFPYDEGCVRNGGRAGASLGPQAFRRFVTSLGPTYNPEFDIDLRSGLQGGVFDAGDVGGEAEDVSLLRPVAGLEDAHRSLEEAVALIIGCGKIPFVIGGGNDQSAANGRGALSFLHGEHNGDAPRPLGIINIDAHLDVRPLLDDGTRVHSGSPFRELLLDPRTQAASGGKHFVEYACQGQQCSKEHAEFVREQGGTLMWLTSLGLVSASFLRAMDVAGENCFVSFDIDAVRSSDCPGVSCPGSVGLSAQDALTIAKMAGRNPNVLLMDVSELNPVIEDYRSPRLAVMMFYHFLLGVAERSGKAK
jgi:formiminoglutamase